jgi:hypothetical protein
MTNALAQAIPPEELYPALEAHLFGPTKIRAFREDDEFRSFRYRFQQTTHVVKDFEQGCQATPSNDSLAWAFDVHPAVVTRALKHGYTVPDIHAKASMLVPAQQAG